jgi:hypothetical protein
MATGVLVATIGDADAYGVKIHQCADLHKVLMDWSYLVLSCSYDTSGVAVLVGHRDDILPGGRAGALYGVLFQCSGSSQ